MKDKTSHLDQNDADLHACSAGLKKLEFGVLTYSGTLISIVRMLEPSNKRYP